MHGGRITPLVMRPAAAAVLVLVPLLWTPTTADAAATTCQGQDATVVGAPGGAAIGTDGPDVIVTGGASGVSGMDGDDPVSYTHLTLPTIYSV